AALGLIVFRVRKHRLKFREMVRARERLESQVELRTRELTESNRQLAEAVQAKSAFLDRMSHELRTPMNGVVGMTELLARTPLSSTQARLTQTIPRSAAADDPLLGARAAADRQRSARPVEDQRGQGGARGAAV